ncbi:MULTISPECIES: extracellular solute-binding protein [Marivita]|uniref:Extracellular solute-binding protein n=1 Tax=Marivita cryptomonadis TaxID=505252 RepID=A0A9Q2PFI9_9RHOB|nr:MULTISPECIES: extracellular solute-binding protein [Marivita]MCR9168548.1 extracellular solute-binding protein [Paracoccaceae bacterium]MBM2323873.1 extracellular solute-binding protein [Marivita cryptomonadis]MBM2333462.1 extracellular solute-binding protein [Marivita cryptomonadis]MBM2343040.1 extracellular solute-binding protein [Marivita cryptomonadis]MBM2347711.1 extracellular solute-binding protein [Marivita cryptomonadis]
MSEALHSDIHFGRRPLQRSSTVSASVAAPELARVVEFLTSLCIELDASIEPNTPNPHLNMILHLLHSHSEGRLVSPSSMVAAAGVPYATATRKLAELKDSGLLEQRPRTKSGKSFSLHPSPRLLDRFSQVADRIERLARVSFGTASETEETEHYYYGGSYQAARATIAPPRALPQPLKLPGGLRILVHGDPTFMVMDNLKRQFEQLVGTNIHQRAFSIDRLREEALRNSDRSKSRYDLIAVDLPWLGEFIKKGVIRPLTDVMDVSRLDPADFHTAGWRAAHWDGTPYGVPSQTTPELMFYRKDWFASEGLEPPVTTDAVIDAARHFHDPRRGRYGVAWNAARGTALGHTFMMTCAAFGQPIIDLPEIAGGYDADHLGSREFRPALNTDRALAAADYLMQLLEFSPPDILSMSWYERVRPYASGKVAMAYGYTLLAPYFELDDSCSAHGNTGYLPHPHGPEGAPIAPVGGYVFCVPSNLAEERLEDTVEALVAFTSPGAQKLYAQSGSRTAPRYSVGADPEVRRLSPIFELVDQMSWRDELQFWPRPPIPQISDIIRICGHELHDMLRGIVSPREALDRAQARAEDFMRQQVT